MTAQPITHSTQCTLCESHCGILVTVTDGAVARIAGNPDDVLSKGYICPKATAMGGVHEDPDRLRQPMKRVGDSFEPVSWEQAYTEIGRRLRKVRADHGNRAAQPQVGSTVERQLPPGHRGHHLCLLRARPDFRVPKHDPRFCWLRHTLAVRSRTPERQSPTPGSVD